MLTIHTESHVDHALTTAQMDWIVAHFVDKSAFFIETVELPVELGTVPCGLYGPVMGDAPVAERDVLYERRGSRAWDSRLIDRPARPTRKVTVIAGEHAGLPCVLYTAFGGPLAPKEPGDTTMKAAERDNAIAFWAQHALAK